MRFFYAIPGSFCYDPAKSAALTFFHPLAAERVCYYETPSLFSLSVQKESFATPGQTGNRSTSGVKIDHTHRKLLDSCFSQSFFGQGDRLIDTFRDLFLMCRDRCPVIHFKWCTLLLMIAKNSGCVFLLPADTTAVKTILRKSLCAQNIALPRDIFHVSTR